jgi:cytoskeleton protein RodZ
MSDEQEEAVVAKASPTIGDRLKQAREAKSYTIAEVAAQLRLTKDIVVALENQEWENLNGRTYARGYFASYVKFLGLPFEEMLAVFNLEYTATEPALNLKQTGHKEEARAFPWFMLAFVAIALLVVWLAYQQWQASQIAEQASMSMQQNGGQGEANFDDSVVEPLAEEPAFPTQANAPSATRPADELTMSDETLGEINAAEQASVAAGSENEAEPLAAEVSPTLRVTFTAECWVEVTDDNAKVLVSKVMQADQNLELEASQPLHLLLGRAAAASVFFNDEQVDLKPYTQGDVARLTLGVES